MLINDNIAIIAMYDVLGTLWEDYKLPPCLENLWNMVDKKVNSTNINWELFRKDNHEKYMQVRENYEMIFNS